MWWLSSGCHAGLLKHLLPLPHLDQGEVEIFSNIIKICLLSMSMNLYILDFLYKWNYVICGLYVSLLSLSISHGPPCHRMYQYSMPLYSQIASYHMISTPCLFIVEYHPIIWIHNILFVHQLMDIWIIFILWQLWIILL